VIAHGLAIPIVVAVGKVAIRKVEVQRCCQ
jgi:hypothetical protein